MTRESWLKRRFWTEIYEMFTFRGHLPPKKTPNLEVLEGVKQAPHSEQDTGQGMHCREILFTPCCSSVAREFPRSVSFFCDVRLRSYGSSKLPNFRILVYFSHTKLLKKVPSSDQPTAQGLHRRMIPIFPCDSRRSGSGVFLRLLVGELWTPKLAQIFLYGKWLYPYRMLLHGASGLDQRCLKPRRSAVVALLGGFH